MTHKHTILLVDDEEYVLHSMSRLLRKEGYSILTATNAIEALAILKENPVALIISDQTMPGIKGIDLLKTIKARYPETVRIILTGNADDNMIITAINEGEVYRFLTKPWNGDELKLTIKHALEHHDLLQQVKNARWRYTDETGFHVNGEKWWLWNFRTDNDVSFAVIRKSRGRNVLKEVYGEKPPPGADITDGWRAYSYLEHVQRCWAHLLREVDDYKERSSNGKDLSREMHQRFHDLTVFLDKDPSMEERKYQKNKWDEELAALVETYSKFDDLKKPVKYIKFGLGCWYTCLLYPGMQPTNNLGEQAIREHVVMRMIIGTFRSEHGSENYQYIASMFATWRLQGKNVFDELEKLLRRELCLS